MKAKLRKTRHFLRSRKGVTHQQIRKRAALGNQAIQVFPISFLSQTRERD